MKKKEEKERVGFDGVCQLLWHAAGLALTLMRFNLAAFV